MEKETQSGRRKNKKLEDQECYFLKHYFSGLINRGKNHIKEFRSVFKKGKIIFSANKMKLMIFEEGKRKERDRIRNDNRRMRYCISKGYRLV